jgi:hypothetical protein
MGLRLAAFFRKRPVNVIYQHRSWLWFGCISHHDCFKHAAGQDIFLLDWRQVLSYDVSLLNISLVVNSVIDCQIFIDSPNSKQS